MAKKRSVYVCQSCGAQAAKWAGRCAACGEWNSLVEEVVEPARKTPARGGSSPQRLKEIPTSKDLRIATGSGELDRVLGGGLVEGSAVLVGGEPGIGKSTLLLQVSAGTAAQGKKCLYVTGEESAGQTKLRAERIGACDGDVMILAETDLESIMSCIEGEKPELVVVDSIQAVFDPALESAPGTVSQVRECAGRLVRAAKEMGFPLFLIGHVTKQGTLAGPRTLEHVVDTVLYFEGDRFHSYRLLRTAKNRFGSTDELAVFMMTDRGLEEVENASSLFLAERDEARPGCAVCPVVEGTRVLLVEVQALLSPTPYAAPRQRVTGADAGRVAMLAAVLGQRCGLNLAGQDVFVNIVGGIQVEEPAVDLAVCAAMASALKGAALPLEMVVFGEVGLTGEVRPVGQMDKRLNEAARLGFATAVIPQRAPRVRSGMGVIRAKSLGEALGKMMEAAK